MLTGILRDKKYLDVIVIYRRFRDEVFPDIYTFNILMNCYCSVDCTGYGFGILAMVMKRGYFPDVVTYSTLIHWLCRAGEWEKAEFLFAQMKRGGVAPNVVENKFPPWSRPKYEDWLSFGAKQGVSGQYRAY